MTKAEHILREAALVGASADELKNIIECFAHMWQDKTLPVENLKETFDTIQHKCKSV